MKILKRAGNFIKDNPLVTGTIIGLCIAATFITGGLIWAPVLLAGLVYAGAVFGGLFFCWAWHRTPRKSVTTALGLLSGAAMVVGGCLLAPLAALLCFGGGVTYIFRKMGEWCSNKPSQEIINRGEYNPFVSTEPSASSFGTYANTLRPIRLNHRWYCCSSSSRNHSFTPVTPTAVNYEEKNYSPRSSRAPGASL